jgi:hypothetical protein
LITELIPFTNELPGNTIAEHQAKIMALVDKASDHTAGLRMNEKPSIGANKPFPAPLPPSEDYVVDFEGPDDPEHPQNWRPSTK